MCTERTTLDTNSFVAYTDKEHLLCRRMRSERIKPDAYTFVALLTATARSGDAEWADLAPFLAATRDAHFSLNTYVCTASINAIRACRGILPSQRCALAQRELDFMRENRVQVTAETINSIISLYAECGDPESAISMLGVMAELEIEPSQRTYSALIGVCQDHAMMEQAAEFEELRRTMWKLHGSVKQNTGKGWAMR